MEVFLSEVAKVKLKELTHHLLKDWNYKVKMDFLAKLDAKINQISKHPESCPGPGNLLMLLQSSTDCHLAL